MSKCHIVKIKHKDYAFMIVTEKEDPMLHLERISFELNNHGVKDDKKILFDNLLFIGDSENRFLEGIFDGKDFTDNDFKTITLSKKNPIRKATVVFLNTARISLNSSALSPMQKMKIKKGIPI